jgi:hypothetical protein
MGTRKKTGGMIDVEEFLPGILNTGERVHEGIPSSATPSLTDGVAMVVRAV